MSLSLVTCLSACTTKMGNLLAKASQRPVLELPQQRPHVFFRDPVSIVPEPARPARPVAPVAKPSAKPSADAAPLDVTLDSDMPSLVGIQGYMLHNEGYAAWPSSHSVPKFNIYEDSPREIKKKLDKHAMKSKRLS